jgi:hypothetical protein
MTGPRGIGRLAIAGASAFWIVNLLISLTPVAADYRSALSIRYVPMLIEAALGGLLTALIEVPGKFLGSLPDPWRLLIISMSFNALRILALGIVIGRRGNRTRRQ